MDELKFGNEPFTGKDLDGDIKGSTSYPNHTKDAISEKHAKLNKSLNNLLGKGIKQIYESDVDNPEFLVGRINEARYLIDNLMYNQAARELVNASKTTNGEIKLLLVNQATSIRVRSARV